jgi:transcriptional regulator with XRE-family HTH domain
VTSRQRTTAPRPDGEPTRAGQPQTFILDGLRLRQLRRQRGLSQEELADRAGVSVTTVGRLERQARAPCRGRTLGRLARALGEHPATTTLRAGESRAATLPARAALSGPGCNFGRMSVGLAQDEDPNDPEVILRDLPERERAEFLRQYHEAVDAAHDPAGYRRLQRLLHAGRLTVIATSRAGYYEELEAVGGGTARSRPAEEVIPGWPERLAVARAQMR